MSKTIGDSASRGRGRIGVVVPVSNGNLEPDLVMMRPAGLSLHFARAGGYDLDQVPDSAQMRKFAEASLDAVVDSLAAARVDVLLYGCTSATLAHGPGFDRDFRRRIEARAAVPAVTAAGALVEALTALSVTRIGFASPYTRALAGEAAAFLEACGFQVLSQAHVASDLGNYGQSDMTPEEAYRLGLEADRPEAEAVVLSCTDLRAAEAIEALEDALGKPVVASNQALIYCALARLGWSTAAASLPGRLARLLPAAA